MPIPDFDLTNVVARHDDVPVILTVAASVLREVGIADNSPTARLARWVVYNLGASEQLTHRIVGRVSDTTVEDGRFVVQRVGQLVGIDHRAMFSEQARQLAAALLICADRADVPT